METFAGHQVRISAVNVDRCAGGLAHSLRDPDMISGLILASGRPLRAFHRVAEFNSYVKTLGFQ